MGLLAKANAYLEQQEKLRAEAQKQAANPARTAQSFPVRTAATNIRPTQTGVFTAHRPAATTNRTVTPRPTQNVQVTPTGVATPRPVQVKYISTLKPNPTTKPITKPTVKPTVNVQPTTNVTKPAVSPVHHSKVQRTKLRKFVAGLFLTISLQATMPFNLGQSSVPSKQPVVNFVKHDATTLPKPTQTERPQINQAVIEEAIKDFTYQLKHSQISNRDRNNLARMLYGEAGRGTDPFEVLHTVLNRMSSPLFKGNVYDILTAKGQYVGFDPANPVLPQLRKIVDFVVDEWEANGCKKIGGCDHYYFVTGIPNNCNKFEISADPQGRWVPNSQKKYEKLHHYCGVATDQAARFKAETHLGDYVRPM